MLYRRIQLKNNLGYYFPLFNQNGFKSTITPNLIGDVKLDYHHYILEPISEIGLYDSYGRHVIIYINDVPYYLSGKGIHQQDDILDVTYNSISQKVVRTNDKYQITTTSFIPYNKQVELHEIKYLNKTIENQKIKVITAPLLYGRSVDNLFDHRHVTSLLNRSEVIEGGILLKPTLSFDERGHIKNDYLYYFLANSNDISIDGYYPSYDEFINGGSMLYPKGLNNKYQVGHKVSGYETIGGVSFKEITLKPNEEIKFYMAFGITLKEEEIFNTKTLLTSDSFNKLLVESNKANNELYQKMQFYIKDDETSKFLSFLEVQPVLRRLFGNSYLPHHDYGKGGRGWRDLFQDLLFMIMTFDKSVKDQLINNFKGIRIDGSNATIIGNKPGEFKADRNNITRVWSDHSAWPLLSIDSYINYFNDYEILLEKVSYFDDQFTHYTRKTKLNVSNDNILRSNGEIYKGTILEHLILQNVVSIYNTGEKGFIRIEDADWNDGLDMARDLGETISFTHFFINNIKILIKYLNRFEEVELFESLGILIEDGNLSKFFDKVKNFNEVSKTYQTKELIKHLQKQIDKLKNNIYKYAFMENGALQSYVDNDGNWLDNGTVSLTGQAMALLSMTIVKEDATTISKVVKNRLFNEDLGGYHLNENYNEVKMNMGRAYGFSYNHKENGAVFSHMALMYTYGLFNYELSKNAHEGTFAIINQAMNKDSLIPLGIPEYFTDKGHGKYFYLTGSATWLLKVLKEQIFGLKMIDGTLVIKPQMMASDFILGVAKIKTIIFDNLVEVTFYNKNNKDHPHYEIDKIIVDGIESSNQITKVKARIEVYLV